MRAFVVRPNGGLALFITGEYKTVKGLIRYGVKPFIKQPVDVEIFYNWDHRYRDNPDRRIGVKP
jgi:hypothetical protein